MEHDKFMERCLDLAQNGRTTASPNPMVGSVIVHNGEIIGEGWHHHSGTSHAEVNAIASVKNRSLLSKSVLYVNLEPCAHHGKTPPCSDLIIENKIPEVVVGSGDPFAEVNGRGILKMQKAGIQVISGVLRDQCIELNKRFFSFHLNKRPFIILKWAQTADGFIDKLRDDNQAHQNKISGKAAQLYVHRMRATEDAILIGAQTAINDNPALTTRLLAGKNPIRILIDPKLRVPDGNRIFKEEGKLIVYNFLLQENRGEVAYVKTEAGENLLTTILKDCYSRNILSIIVEGGSKTLQSFIDANLWDEIHVVESDMYYRQGVPAPQFAGRLFSKAALGDDNLYLFKNT